MSIKWLGARALCFVVGAVLAFQVSAASRLAAGQELLPGSSISSPNGRYRLVLQFDGNLVQYRDGATPIWSTSTSDGIKAVMQYDGNFVLYNAAAAPRFNTVSYVNPGAALEAQDDGNLVVYSAGNVPLWNKGPDFGSAPPVTLVGGLGSGAVLQANQVIVSPFGRYYLSVTAEGVLAMFRAADHSIRWRAGTADAGWLAMQTDGNLVLYGRNASAVWSSGTQGRTGATLGVQEDGNLVIYSGSTPIWHIGPDGAAIPPASTRVLSPVIVTASSMDFSSGSFESTSSSASYAGREGIGIAIANAKDAAWKLSSVCNNPFVSQAAKATSSQSGVKERWLAAQELFNVIQARNMLSMYGAATNGLKVIVNGVTYKGFDVTYKDGFRERWVMSPTYATSTVKLFDQPLPDSLKEPTGDWGKC